MNNFLIKIIFNKNLDFQIENKCIKQLIKIFFSPISASSPVESDRLVFRWRVNVDGK